MSHRKIDRKKRRDSTKYGLVKTLVLFSAFFIGVDAMGKKKGNNIKGANDASIGYLLDYYVYSLKAANRSLKTINWYLEILERFFAFLSTEALSKPVTELGPSELKKYILHLQQAECWPKSSYIKKKGQLSSYSIQGHVRAVKAFWSWLHE